MRGSAGLGMWAARQRHREGGRGDGPLLAIAAMFFAEFTDVLPLSVSMKEVSMKQVASKYPFYILMYMIFHLFRFIYFLKLKKNMENIFQYLNFCTPNFIMGWHTWALLLSPYKKGVAKYAHIHRWYEGVHTKGKGQKGGEGQQGKNNERNKNRIGGGFIGAGRVGTEQQGQKTITMQLDWHECFHFSSHTKRTHNTIH